MSRIVCDPYLCSGCLACVVACIDEHYDETQGNALSARIYEKRISKRTGLVSYITRSCLHCGNAGCMEACKQGALVRDERGFVILKRELCIGCRACAKACPFDVPRFDSEGKLVKCDGCSERLAEGGEPACVRICNTRALSVSESIQ